MSDDDDKLLKVEAVMEGVGPTIKAHVDRHMAIDRHMATLARLEPDIFTSVTDNTTRMSMAFSLRRIADNLDTLTKLLTAEGLGKLFEDLKPIVERKENAE